MLSSISNISLFKPCHLINWLKPYVLQSGEQLLDEHAANPVNDDTTSVPNNAVCFHVTVSRPEHSLCVCGLHISLHRCRLLQLLPATQGMHRGCKNTLSYILSSQTSVFTM